MASALDDIRTGGKQGNAVVEDIRIGEQLNDAPGQLSPVQTGTGTKAELTQPGGFPLIPQFFGFNPDTGFVGLLSDLPRPITIQGRYGNKLIDAAGFKTYKRMNLGRVTRGSDDYLGSAEVGISFEDYSKVMISPNYITSPVGTERGDQTGATGNSVVVVFDPRGVAGFLNISRNGSRPAQFSLNSPGPIMDTEPVSEYTGRYATGDKTPFNIDTIPVASTGFPIVELWNVHRKTDALQWSVTQDGKVTHKGVVGFPVVGTAHKRVYYQVRISDRS